MKRVINLLLAMLIVMTSQPVSVGAASFDEAYLKYQNETSNPLALESVELKIVQLLSSAIDDNKLRDEGLVTLLNKVGATEYVSVIKQNNIKTLPYLMADTHEQEAVDYTKLMIEVDTPTFDVTLIPMVEDNIKNFLISVLNKAQVTAYNVLNNSSEDVDISYDYTILDNTRQVIMVMSSIREDYQKSIPQFNETVLELTKIVRAGRQENSFVSRLEYLKFSGATSKLGVVGEDSALESTVSTFDGKGDLGTFFVDKGSDYYYVNEILIGQALSSLYKPLHTNIYEKEYIDIPNDEKFTQFDSKFGGLRKALLIDDSRKAATSWMSNSRVKRTRVAALRDLLYAKDEILLFTDSNYYNVDTLHENFSGAAGTGSRVRTFELKNSPAEQDVTPAQPEVDQNTPALDPVIDEAAPLVDPPGTAQIDNTLPLYVHAVDLIAPPVMVYASTPSNSDLKNLASLYKWLNKRRTNDISTNITEAEIKEAFSSYITNGGELWDKSLDFKSGFSVSEDDVKFALKCVRAVDSIGKTAWVKEKEGTFEYNLFYLKATVFKSYINTYSNLPKIPKWGTNKAFDFDMSDDMANVLVRALSATEQDTLCNGKEGNKVGGYYSYVNSALAEDTASVRTANYVKLEEAILGGSPYLEESHRYQEFRNLLVKRVINSNALAGKAVITPSAVAYICLYDDNYSSDFVTYMLNDYDASDAIPSSEENILEKYKGVSELLNTPVSSISGKLRWRLAGLQAYLNHKSYVAKFKTEYGFPQAKDMDEELKNKSSNAYIIFDKLGIIEIVQSLSKLNSFKDDLGSLMSDGQKQFTGTTQELKAITQHAVENLQSTTESYKSKSEAAQSGTKALNTQNGTPLDTVTNEAEAKEILEYLTSTGTVDEAGNNIKGTETLDRIVSQYLDAGAPLHVNKETQVALMASSKLEGFIASAKLKDFTVAPSDWTGLALTRDVYSAGTLADTISTNDNKPIFMASKKSSVPLSVDAYYNELLFDNIRDGLSVHYISTLDLDSPLFIDIYGNILTESGLVVIPFAANGTLHKTYNMMTVSFLLNYGRNTSIEVDPNSTLGLINGFPVDIQRASLNSLGEYPYLFENDYTDTQIITADISGTYYLINPIIVSTDDGSLTLSRLSSMDIRTQQLLYNLNYSLYLGRSGAADFNIMDAPTRTNIVTSRVIFEVTRGAPLDMIDYANENLYVDMNFDSGSLSRAMQLDSLTKAVDSLSLNTVIAIPDVNYVKGVEYAIFFLYKLVLIAYVLFLAFYFYKAGVSQTFGWLTFPKAIFSFALVMLLITQLSSIFSLSYYSATKKLLQPEAVMLMMLNEEKRNNGIELGVMDAEPVTTGSDLQLKVKKVKVPWYDLLVDMIALNDVHSMGEIYERKAKSDIELVASDNYILKGDTVYMSVQDLFDSTELYTDFNSSQLVNIVSKENPVAFRLPYYAFLDYIVYSVNAYNNTLESYDYTQMRLADGRTRSSGLSERYFNSTVYRIHRNDVLSNRDSLPQEIDIEALQLALYDKAGIFQIYEQSAWDNRDIYRGTAPSFTNNQWYVDNLPEKDIRDIADKLDSKAINWVKDHTMLCGKISDEVFIKSLAIYLSLEYNKMAHVPGPREIEIHAISNSDLLRMLLSDTKSVLTNSTYSFPKLMLEEGGTVGIYLSAMLYIVILLLTFVRPAATVVVVLSAIVSIVMYKLLLSKKSENVKGFCKMVLLIILLNLLYSVLLKGLIVLAGLHINILIALILAIAFHVFQLLANVWISVMVVRNWQDYGNLALDTMVKERTVDVNILSNQRSEYTEQTEKRSAAALEYYEKLEQLEHARSRRGYFDDEDL